MTLSHRLPSKRDMDGFAAGAVSFSGMPGARKAIAEAVELVRNNTTLTADPRIKELGALIQKAHGMWLAMGAPGADE